MRFQPSEASYGRLNPDSITAVADLVAASAGAGVAVGGAVAQRRARKKAEAARRRRRRRGGGGSFDSGPPSIDPGPMPAPTPSWVAPVVIVAVVGIIGGVLYSTRQKKKGA